MPQCGAAADNPLEDVRRACKLSRAHKSCCEPAAQLLTDPLRVVNAGKMRAGIALTDEDRWPWLNRLRDILAQHVAE